MISKDFIPNIKKCDIRPLLIKYTDHQAVSIQIQTAATKSKGPGFWKINNSVLTEPEYTGGIQRIIEKYKIILEKPNTNIPLQWDMLKKEIKEYSCSYTKLRAINKKNNIKECEKRINELTERNEKQERKDIKDEIENLTKKLETAYEYKAKGAQLRSKQEWVEKGEKNTAYFFGLEKQRQTKKNYYKATE